MTPGTVGPNRFVARVTDYDTGEPVPADRVILEFALRGKPDVGSTLPLEHRPDRSWAGQSTAIAIVGDWDVTVLMQDAEGSTEVPLHDPPPGPSPDDARLPAGGAARPLHDSRSPPGCRSRATSTRASPGINQFHVTTFDASGQELPLASAGVHAEGPSGSAPLDMERFSPGHFIANFDLVPGTWTFMIDVATKDGSELSARFRETFQG